MSQVAPDDAPRPRRAVAPRWVLLGLAISFVLAFGVAAFLYQKFVAFERVAGQHVLPNSELLVYVDLEKVVLYEPFRAHLLPLVAQGLGDPRLKPRLTRIKQHTRIELGVDIRELVFSRRPATGGWALAIGGMFPNTGVVAGLSRVLEEEGRPQQLDAAGRVLTFSNGTRVGQALDSVVVFASDLTHLEAALGKRPSAAGGTAYAQLLPVAETPAVSRLTVRLALGEPAAVTVVMELRDRSGANRNQAEVWLREQLRIWGAVEPATVRFEAAAPGELEATFPVAASNLDHAAERFAQIIRLSAFSGTSG